MAGLFDFFIGLFHMDDKVKIRCPKCTRVFRERANAVRDGSQINCQHCNRLITLNRDTEDPFIRRSLKSAKEVRDALLALRTPASYASET
jgi:transposase-like protein